MTPLCLLKGQRSKTKQYTVQVQKISCASETQISNQFYHCVMEESYFPLFLTLLWAAEIQVDI